MLRVMIDQVRAHLGWLPSQEVDAWEHIPQQHRPHMKAEAHIRSLTIEFTYADGADTTDPTKIRSAVIIESVRDYATQERVGDVKYHRAVRGTKEGEDLINMYLMFVSMDAPPGTLARYCVKWLHLYRDVPVHPNFHGVYRL